MRSRKKLIILFSILLIVVVIIILISTLFNLKEIEVRYVNGMTAELSTEDIASNVAKYKGKNLLFLSEKSVTESVKATTPYIKTVELERIFPNKIIIYVSGREELFALKLTDEGQEKYFLTDITGQVLRKSASPLDNNKEDQKENILIRGITEDDLKSQPKVGDRLSLADDYKLNFALDAMLALNSFEEPYGYTVPQMKDFIDYIDISDTKYPAVATKQGVRFVFSAYDKDVMKQMQVAIGVYNQLEDDQKSGGKLILISDASSTLGYSCNYKPEEFA